MPAFCSGVQDFMITRPTDHLQAHLATTTALPAQAHWRRRCKAASQSSQKPAIFDRPGRGGPNLACRILAEGMLKSGR